MGGGGAEERQTQRRKIRTHVPGFPERERARERACVCVMYVQFLMPACHVPVPRCTAPTGVPSTTSRTPNSGIRAFGDMTSSRSPGMSPCPMVLVFGCRQSKVDHIYREETLQARDTGVFRELYAAYSREPDKPKVTPALPRTRVPSQLRPRRS